jgi:hypothetical protein
MKDNSLVRLRTWHLFSARCMAQTAERRLEKPLFNILIELLFGDARTPYPIGN